MKRVNDTLYDILDSSTSEVVTFSKVTTFVNFQPMTDAYCDGVIYRKFGSEYFKRNYSGLIDVKVFGAKGDWINDDTEAIQKAINVTRVCGVGLKFSPGNYRVSTLTTGRIENTWQFDNAQLVANSNAPQDCLLKFSGLHCKINGLKISLEKKLNYKSAIWWYNAAESSQHNDFISLEIRYAKIGIIYGELPNVNSTGFAQSENTIFGYKTRGVEVPLYNNHSNGFLFLSNPMLVAHAEEWNVFGVTGFDRTKNRSFINRIGDLIITGGEIQNSIGDEAEGFAAEVNGGTVYITSAISEVNVPFKINGGSLVFNGGKVLNTQSITDGFKITADAANGKLKASGVKFERSIGVGAFSGRVFINKQDAPASFNIAIDNCEIYEWADQSIGSNKPLVSGSVENVKIYNTKFIETSGFQPLNLNLTTNILDSKDIDNTGNSTTGYSLKVNYGAGTTLTLNNDSPVANTPNSLALLATGEANVSTIDYTSVETIQKTGFRVNTGDAFIVEAYQKIASGAQGGLCIVGYDKDGDNAQFIKISDQGGPISANWKCLRSHVIVPSGVSFVGFGFWGAFSEIRIAKMVVYKANQ